MYMKLTSNLENMINHIYHTPLPETVIPCSSLCPPMSQRKFWMLQSVFIKTSHVYPFFGIQKTVPGTSFWPKVPSCCIFHNSSRVSSQDHPQWRELGPWDDVDVLTPLYGLLVRIYGIGFEYLVPLGYIYIYVYIHTYNHIYIHTYI